MRRKIINCPDQDYLELGEDNYDFHPWRHFLKQHFSGLIAFGKPTQRMLIKASYTDNEEKTIFRIKNSKAGHHNTRTKLTDR